MTEGFVVSHLEVGMAQNFCTIFTAPDGSCAVVDPAFEVDRVVRAIAEKKGRVVAILVTHTHLDHIEGVEELARLTGAPAYVGAGELANLREHAPTADLRTIGDNDKIPIGQLSISALATPGHTVDARSYYDGAHVATGDTLFVGGVGRTDFPGGDPATLYRSLCKLGELPEETRVFPGHDYGATPTSTIGWEKSANPYLRCASAAEFIALRTGARPPRPTRGPR